MAFIHLRLDGPVAVISLDHPEGNRINFMMRQELLTAMRQVADSSARVLLLRAEGRDFSLGGDVREWPGVPSNKLRPKIAILVEAIDQLESLSIPTIAAVQGRCMGGGLELILACDLVIAGESAVFGCPEAMLGIVTLQGGVVQLAQRIGPARAFEFVYFSEAHKAEEMSRLNLVNRVVADAQLDATVKELVERLASRSAGGICHNEDSVARMGRRWSQRRQIDPL